MVTFYCQHSKSEIWMIFMISLILHSFMLHCNGNYCNTNLDNWQKYRLMSWVLSCHNAKRDFYRLIFSTALNQNWSKNFHRIFWEAQTLSLMLDELITYRVRQQVMRFSHDFCKILAIVCSPGWLIDASWFQNAKKYFFAKRFTNWGISTKLKRSISWWIYGEKLILIEKVNHITCGFSHV